MWYLNEFENFLRSKQLSERTVGVYRLHIGRFIRYCEARDLVDCKTVGDDDVLDYIRGVLEPLPHTPGWKYVASLCLRRYFVFLVDRSLLFAPPALSVKKPRYCSGSYKAVEKKKLRILLDSFPVTKEADIMAKAILELGYSAALRPGEIRRLKLEDIDFSNKVLFIGQGKGKKDRTVPVGSTALEWIRRYIRDVRPHRLKEPSERILFIGMRSGAPLTDRAFTEFLAYRLKRLGLENISPHQLRSSAATHMVSEGMSIGFLKDILGHARLDTTRIYVQIHTDELKKVIQRSHPRVHLENRRVAP